MGKGRADHYNQSLLLEVKAGAETKWLERAWEELQEQHDVLRMRYEEVEGGGWRQWCEEEVKEGGV